MLQFARKVTVTLFLLAHGPHATVHRVSDNGEGESVSSYDAYDVTQGSNPPLDWRSPTQRSFIRRSNVFKTVRRHLRMR